MWSPDDPLIIAAAGSKAKLQLWDIGSNFGARQAFSKKLKEAGKVLREKSGDGQGGVIAVADEDEWSDEDDS